MTYTTEQFLWVPERKQFIAEASDLIMGIAPTKFVMTNPKTGGNAEFTLHNVDREDDNGYEQPDIVAWIYRCTYPTEQRDLTAVIIND